MKFNQLLHDGEPYAEPSVFARDRCVLLTEAVKDVRQKFRINPAAAVAHRDLEVRIHPFEQLITITVANPMPHTRAMAAMILEVTLVLLAS